MKRETFVVLGSGIAGLSAAEAIRERTDAQIMLLGKERVLPYNRPMLTKMPLRGGTAKAASLHDEKWYARNDIELAPGKTALFLDTADKTVTLDDGSDIRYDKCVVATGAENLRLPIPGAGKVGVVGVRAARDIFTIRQILLSSNRAVVVGGGVIGLEIAWELKMAGADVTVMERAPYLMKRVIDEETASVLHDAVEQAGIKLITGAEIKAIEGVRGVSGVTLEDGSLYPAGLVVMAAGISPNIRFAKEAGLDVGHSIKVDSFMRTSAPDVYACGDCAEFAGVNAGAWFRAKEQGRIAGTNAAAGNLEYSPQPLSLFMNALNVPLFCIGDMGKTDGITYETRTARNISDGGGNFINPRPGGSAYEKYYFLNGRMVGAALLGDLSKMKQVRELILRGEGIG